MSGPGDRVSTRGAAAVLCLAVGCSAAPDAGPVGSETWAQEAEVWIEAYDAAAGAWDGRGPPRAQDFYLDSSRSLGRGDERRCP